MALSFQEKGRSYFSSTGIFGFAIDFYYKSFPQMVYLATERGIDENGFQPIFMHIR